MKDTKLVLMKMALLAMVSGCDGEVKQDTTGTGGTGGESTTSSGGTGGTATTGGGGTGGTTTTMTPSGPGGTLAIHVLRMGDTTPEGQLSSTAWKGYGFNLDGKISTAASVDLCKPAEGANPSSVYPDGENGIDNSFGKNVLPIFLALASDFSTQINDAIDGGRFTVITSIEGIEPLATGTFLSKMYTAQFPDGASPSWDGLDAWPVRSDSLVGGDIANPKVQLPASQVTADAAGSRVWQSNPSADIQLVLPMAGLTLVLPIHHAYVQMQLSDDNTKATLGRIGGVLDAEELVAELAKLVGAFDPSLCPPSATFESIAQQIRQASDILKDGSQDPAMTCNGISIGLGFDADAAGLGPVFDAPAAPDPCHP